MGTRFEAEPRGEARELKNSPIVMLFVVLGGLVRVDFHVLAQPVRQVHLVGQRVRLGAVGLDRGVERRRVGGLRQVPLVIEDVDGLQRPCLLAMGRPTPPPVAAARSPAAPCPTSRARPRVVADEVHHHLARGFVELVGVGVGQRQPRQAARSENPCAPCILGLRPFCCRRRLLSLPVIAEFFSPTR